MKKIVIFFVLLISSATVFAQKNKEVKLNKETNLVEAVYYHENGAISQEGTFDMAGKLHGEWVSYDTSGNKVSMGNYNRGVRTGKWVFWADENVREVEFSDNVIASVVNREDVSRVATKN